MRSAESPAPRRAAWPLRLLHRFDPLLLAHKDKAWIVDPERYKAVWRKAGYVEAVILRRGRVAGTWGYERATRGTVVWLAPFLTSRRTWPVSVWSLSILLTYAVWVSVSSGAGWTLPPWVQPLEYGLLVAAVVIAGRQGALTLPDRLSGSLPAGAASN